jgi:hypothetical protein
MATLPQFKQRQIARRSTSDIDRLAKQYKSNIDALTGENQAAFTGYQAAATAKMKPFEEASAKYGKDLAEYTTNVATPYKTALSEYQKNSETYLKQLGEIASGSKDRFAASQKFSYKEKGQTINDYRFINPFTGAVVLNREDLFTNPNKYGFSEVLTPVEAGQRGTSNYLFRPLPEGKAPVAPDKPAAFAGVKPEAPQIGEFDTSQFTAKKTEAEDTFKREVGERRASKLGAVSRKGARPLLSGEKA